MPDIEDTAIAPAETTPPGTPEGRQSYEDVLKGEGEAPEKVPPSGDEAIAEKLPPEPDGGKPNELGPDEEVELEIGGKLYRGKIGVITKFMELVQSLGDDASTALESAEKLAELKKNYDRGFTQKTQEISQFRGLMEQAFGRMPKDDEIPHLGKLYRSYLSDPNAKMLIDAILTGEHSSLFQDGQDGQTDATADPTYKAMRQEIAQLRQTISSFINTNKEERDRSIQQEASRIWSTWKTAKEADTKRTISKDIESAMDPFIDALGRRYPEWDHNKVLDEAFRYATFNDEKVRTVKAVIKSAEDQNKKTPPKINARIGERPDRDKRYSELVTEG